MVYLGIKLKSNQHKNHKRLPGHQTNFTMRIPAKDSFSLKLETRFLLMKFLIFGTIARYNGCVIVIEMAIHEI